MDKHQEEVLVFHKKFDLTVNQYPTEEVTIADRVLRVRLILEEFLEFARASGVNVFVKTNNDGSYKISAEVSYIRKPNIIEIADGLLDLKYVINGAAITYGIDLDEGETEVHRSNMTKVWPDGNVHKDNGGKVIKPPSYSPADIDGVLKRQLKKETKNV